MFVFAPKPRKAEIILFFKPATALVAERRGAVNLSCGGAQMVAEVAQA
jgi:hypothetical protein